MTRDGFDRVWLTKSHSARPQGTAKTQGSLATVWLASDRTNRASRSADIVFGLESNAKTCASRMRLERCDVSDFFDDSGEHLQILDHVSFHGELFFRDLVQL